jgi:hypothetical protein
MKQTNEELKTAEKERQADFDRFKNFVELGGRKIFVVLKGVSRSGMLRHMDFYVFIPCSEERQQQLKRRGVVPKVDKVYLNYFIEKFLNYKRDKNNNHIKVSGCGMDMAFSVVYNIGRVLYSNGDGVTITGRNGDKEPETDGGYLLDYETL